MNYIVGANSELSISLASVFQKRQMETIGCYHNNKNNIEEIPLSPFQSLINLDLEDDASVQKFIDHVLLENNIESLTFVAALRVPSFTQNLTQEELGRHMKVNAISPYFITTKILPIMRSRKYGRVLFCGSVGTKFGGGVKTNSYSFSKHAVEFIPRHFKAAAIDNVLVNCLRLPPMNLGAVDQKSEEELEQRVKMIPCGRLPSLEEVANFISYYVSADNNFVTCQVIDFSGGE